MAENHLPCMKFSEGARTGSSALEGQKPAPSRFAIMPLPCLLSR